jgi:hypothetical protein
MHIKEKFGFKTAAQLISFAARWISTDSPGRQERE